jgi:tetratricopeptide (TPR) repeat protein
LTAERKKSLYASTVVADHLRPAATECDLQAPIQLGDLGWWHYLNGDYQKAVDMLSAVVQQRPGDLNLRLGLAWGQIEIRRYGDALQTLNGAIYEQQIQPERAMVRAVANWQAQEHDEAIRDFDITVSGRPEWGNSSWVKALYSRWSHKALWRCKPSASGENRR